METSFGEASAIKPLHSLKYMTVSSGEYFSLLISIHALSLPEVCFVWLQLLSNYKVFLHSDWTVQNGWN